MRFGLFGGAIRRGSTADSAAYQEFESYVVEADQLGFESVFLVEHHFSGIGQISSSINYLSYLAAKTERIRLGTAVTVLPWHNPVLLAEDVATLDLISNGRVDLGVGKGYRDIEFRGFCIPKDEAQERYDEILAIMRQAWTSTERFSVHTKHFHFDDIIVEPAPLQRPHPPLWTGAGTLESIARVAKSGLNLLLDQYGSFALTQRRIEAFKAACAQCGRRYNPMEVGLTRPVVVTTSPEKTREAIDTRIKRSSAIEQFGRLPGLEGDRPSFAEGGAAVDDAAIIGEPEEVIRRLRILQSWGIDYVMMTAAGGIEGLRLFAREVMSVMGDDTKAAKAAE
jgi:alkanesulfonate monooxygenase SsuD/methylene tetrahydromethanopterin reductase-like flavin-dependent oxidoreductase (luciferase family)